MSCRQAVSARSARGTMERVRRLPVNFGHLLGIEFLEERLGFLRVEFRVRSLDTKEKTIYGSALGELGDIEYRMIRHRQFVHGEHSNHGAERRKQHRALERDRDEHGPAIERAA